MSPHLFSLFYLAIWDLLHNFAHGFNIIVIMSVMKYLRLFALLGFLLSVTFLRAANDDELKQIEAEMLKYMSSNDHETFYSITQKLKDTSKTKDEERWFYYAWSSEGVYEAMHENQTKGLDIAQQIMEYARQEGSIYGEYIALHTKAMVLLQGQDNNTAEKAFLEALDFRRRHFPNESAAEDLRELMKIAYYRGDVALSKKYGYQLLAEPNVTPHHKGRTLYRLCTMAFEENNVEEFNHIYEEMRRLEQSDGIKTINLFTEINHYIINDDYKQALLLVDHLTADTCAERKAMIYHRLGDNEKAYEYMVQYKQISDSIERASHSREVGSLYLRMNNDRLRLEEELLSHQNQQLRYRFYLALGIILILALLFLIYQRHKIVRMLKRDNRMLSYGKKDAERALEDLNELSFYESKNELPLTYSVKINRLCNHLANVIQNHCYKGVTAIFQTEFDDDFEITTNNQALEKLLTHLLNDSARFTNKGFIRLSCLEAGEHVRFAVTDTSLGTDNTTKEDDNVRFSSLNINICQSICRLLHGRIWRDTDYTKGVRFVFEIPKQL